MADEKVPKPTGFTNAMEMLSGCIIEGDYNRQV